MMLLPKKLIRIIVMFLGLLIKERSSFRFTT